MNICIFLSQSYWNHTCYLNIQIFLKWSNHSIMEITPVIWTFHEKVQLKIHKITKVTHVTWISCTKVQFLKSQRYRNHTCHMNIPHKKFNSKITKLQKSHILLQHQAKILKWSNHNATEITHIMWTFYEKVQYTHNKITEITHVTRTYYKKKLYSKITKLQKSHKLHEQLYKNVFTHVTEITHVTWTSRKKVQASKSPS